MLCVWNLYNQDSVCVMYLTVWKAGHLDRGQQASDCELSRSVYDHWQGIIMLLGVQMRLREVRLKVEHII